MGVTREKIVKRDLLEEHVTVSITGERLEDTVIELLKKLAETTDVEEWYGVIAENRSWTREVDRIAGWTSYLLEWYAKLTSCSIKQLNWMPWMALFGGMK